ncbi:hypothetical protein QQS21_002627 [Conoideocrella luteorostrata]|uniref:Uncharacterized protein n=1 Tax=Conoideocrella luteorostrata TaxID=1105319 RepID=A0AAJ0CXJ0_9HYPO|nr:hypothetical protein QQS21_002627 [Conoideocrella luteorostrata]
MAPRGTGGKVVDSLDASDGTEIRKGAKGVVETNELNAAGTRDFHFQHKYAVEPAKSQTFLARILIGRKKTSTGDVKEILEGVEIPFAGGSESCVDWVQSAMEHLQGKEWVEKFDINKFPKRLFNTASGDIKL